MQITNQTQTSVPSADNSANSAPPPRNDAPSVSSPSSSPSFPAYPVSLVPSFELLSLASTLQQVPPVRQEVVAEAVRRLASGELQSSSAIDQTARAILGI